MSTSVTYLMSLKLLISNVGVRAFAHAANERAGTCTHVSVCLSICMSEYMYICRMYAELYVCMNVCMQAYVR